LQSRFLVAALVNHPGNGEDGVVERFGNPKGALLRLPLAPGEHAIENRLVRAVVPCLELNAGVACYWLWQPANRVLSASAYILGCFAFLNDAKDVARDSIFCVPAAPDDLSSEALCQRGHV
jgi:hypothetical protein